jgi:hypothetical protein
MKAALLAHTTSPWSCSTANTLVGTFAFRKQPGANPSGATRPPLLPTRDTKRHPLLPTECAAARRRPAPRSALHRHRPAPRIGYGPEGKGGGRGEKGGGGYGWAAQPVRGACLVPGPKARGGILPEICASHAALVATAVPRTPLSRDGAVLRQLCDVSCAMCVSQSGAM